MAERKLHAEPVDVTIGKVTAKTIHHGALVRVNSEDWSLSFPIASLEHRYRMHDRRSKYENTPKDAIKRDKDIARALNALIDAIADAKQAAKEKAHG